MYQKDYYTVRDTIEYLNKVAGTNFQHEDQTTQSLLNLKKEGFTLKDFKTVVDKKWAEWNGTKFQQYVRPETLFGKNFKTYLNEQPRIRKTKFHKLAESVIQAKQHNWKLD